MPGPGERWQMGQQEEWLRRAWEQDEWEQTRWEQAERADAAYSATSAARPRRPPPAVTVDGPRSETPGAPGDTPTPAGPMSPPDNARRRATVAAILTIVAVVLAGYPWWYQHTTGQMGEELTSTFPALDASSWECGEVRAHGRPRPDSVSMECDRGSSLVEVTRFRTPDLAADYEKMRVGELLADAKVRPWKVGGTLAGERFVNGGGVDAQGDRRSLWAGFFYNDARYVVEVVADDKRSITRIVRGLDLPPVAALPD